MSPKVIMISPVTRLSGLLSVEVILENNAIIDVNASSTMFRGYEWIMHNRHVTDAVYMTQRVCGICSTAHGAAASYLLDDIFANAYTWVKAVKYGGQYLQVGRWPAC